MVTGKRIRYANLGHFVSSPELSIVSLTDPLGGLTLVRSSDSIGDKERTDCEIACSDHRKKSVKRVKRKGALSLYATCFYISNVAILCL
jgi:hypothetical protein